MCYLILSPHKAEHWELLLPPFYRRGTWPGVSASHNSPPFIVPRFPGHCHCQQLQNLRLGAWKSFLTCPPHKFWRSSLCTVTTSIPFLPFPRPSPTFPKAGTLVPRKGVLQSINFGKCPCHMPFPESHNEHYRGKGSEKSCNEICLSLCNPAFGASLVVL